MQDGAVSADRDDHVAGGDLPVEGAVADLPELAPEPLVHDRHTPGGAQLPDDRLHQPDSIIFGQVRHD